MPATRCLWLTVMLMMRGSVGEMEPFHPAPPPSQVIRYPSIGSSSDGESLLPGNERKNAPDGRILFPSGDNPLFPSPGKRSGMEEAEVEELEVSRRAFNPWGGKKRGRGVERKVDAAFDKRPGFQPWGGKRAFNPWGGKRGSSRHWSRDDRSKAFQEERKLNENKRNP